MITRLTPFRSVGPCPFAAWVDVAMTVESPIPGPELEEMHAVAGPHSARQKSILIPVKMANLTGIRTDLQLARVEPGG